MEKEPKRNISIEEHAVKHVSDGEARKFVNNKISHRKIDWKEFAHLFTSWFICGIVICAVLMILTMSEKSDDLFKDMVIRIDTISLMFSLVLSAGLEQVWNIKKDWKYKFSQIAELVLAIVGLIMYLAYSLWDIYDPQNLYYKDRFWMNLIYIVLSFICVVIGFIMRARIEE